jgi:hypothetical protein
VALIIAVVARAQPDSAKGNEKAQFKLGVTLGTKIIF